MGGKTAKQRKRRKLNLWREQGKSCCYCNKNTWLHGHAKRGHVYDQATIEHVVPRAIGGRKNLKSNQRSSCAHCNGLRGTIPHDIFKAIRRLDEWEHVSRRLAKRYKVDNRENILQ